MKLPQHPTLIRRSLLARQKDLQDQSPVLAASLVTIRRTCGNPNCRCARGQKHLGHYLTWKVQGKTGTPLTSRWIWFPKSNNGLKNTVAAKRSSANDTPTDPGSDPDPCDCPAAQARKVIALVKIFLKTVLEHFFPESPDRLDQSPDTRFQPLVEYHRRFLCWWGLLLFGLGLGSRRSAADSDLRDLELAILHNLNLLAGTHQEPPRSPRPSIILSDTSAAPPSPNCSTNTPSGSSA